MIFLYYIIFISLVIHRAQMPIFLVSFEFIILLLGMWSIGEGKCFKIS